MADAKKSSQLHFGSVRFDLGQLKYSRLIVHNTDARRKRCLMKRKGLMKN